MPALAQLRRLIDQAEGDAVKLAAVRDVLDRCGLKPADLVAVDNTVRVHVSYEDRGLAPSPEPPGTHRNGQHALNGQQSG